MGSDQSSPQKKWHAVENSSAYKHLTLDQKNTLLKLRYDLQTGQTNSVEYVNGAQKFESRAFDTILSQLGLRQQAEYYKQDGVYIGNKMNNKKPTWYQVISNYWRYGQGERDADVYLSDHLKWGNIVATVHSNTKETTETFGELLRKISAVYENNDLVYNYIHSLHERMEQPNLPTNCEYRSSKIATSKKDDGQKVVHLFRFIYDRDPNLLRALCGYRYCLFEYYELSAPPTYRDDTNAVVSPKEDDLVLPSDFNYRQFFTQYKS